MEQYLQYAQTFGANEKVQKWIEKRLSVYLKKNTPSVSEVEHIIDYLMSDMCPTRISQMRYEEAKHNAEKWNKALQKKGKGLHDKKGDTETVLDFKDGYKIVKLISENSYKREGTIMGHCVGGYYGNGKEIFSLRDKDNIPHCTMEKDNQIKGRGNGDVIEKYIDYVVKFLEHSGMQVRDSEMAHLGYEVVKFGKYSKTKLYKDTYIKKGKTVEYIDNLKIFTNKTELKNYLGKGIVVFDGNLIIDKKEKVQLSKLEQVTGYVYVYEKATFIAPKLVTVGSVYVRENATFTAPKLEQVAGYVYVLDNATFTAPKLATAEYVDVRENATFTAPKLEQVTGYVDVYENATFIAPKLATAGSVDVYENTTFTAPKLEQVTGSVYVRENTTFTAPKLATAEYVDVYQNVTFTAPKLEQVVGSVYVYEKSTFTAPKLATVGSVYVRESGKLIAPLLGYK